MGDSMDVQDGAVSGKLIPAGDDTYLLVDGRGMLCGRLEHEGGIWVAYHVSDAPTGRRDVDVVDLAKSYLREVADEDSGIQL